MLTRREQPWWRDADYADALEREIEDLTRDLRCCHDARDREEQRERIDASQASREHSAECSAYVVNVVSKFQVAETSR